MKNGICWEITQIVTCKRHSKRKVVEVMTKKTRSAPSVTQKSNRIEKEFHDEPH